MSDKIQQARRAAFEEWWKCSGLTKFQETAWAAFNAALDCVVIELPAPEDGLVKSYGPLLYIDEVVDAIESTNLGIKVK